VQRWCSAKAIESKSVSMWPEKRPTFLFIEQWSACIESAGGTIAILMNVRDDNSRG
jgi:hypothetical protein